MSVFQLSICSTFGYWCTQIFLLKKWNSSGKQTDPFQENYFLNLFIDFGDPNFFSKQALFPTWLHNFRVFSSLATRDFAYTPFAACDHFLGGAALLCGLLSKSHGTIGRWFAFLSQHQDKIVVLFARYHSIRYRSLWVLSGSALDWTSCFYFHVLRQKNQGVPPREKIYQGWPWIKY